MSLVPSSLSPIPSSRTCSSSTSTSTSSCTARSTSTSNPASSLGATVTISLSLSLVASNTLISAVRRICKPRLLYHPPRYLRRRHRLPTCYMGELAHRDSTCGGLQRRGIYRQHVHLVLSADLGDQCESCTDIFLRLAAAQALASPTVAGLAKTNFQLNIECKHESQTELEPCSSDLTLLALSDPKVASRNRWICKVMDRHTLQNLQNRYDRQYFFWSSVKLMIGRLLVSAYTWQWLYW